MDAGERLQKNTTLPEFVSVVVPVFNERESICELVEGIEAVCSEVGVMWEIIAVDDGSTDGSDHVLDELATEAQCDLSVIHLRRNFGKAAALCAGFQAVRGDVVITIDADLQDDPAEIPGFLKAIADGLDVVSGYKKTRRDPWHKVVVSRVFNWMVRRVTGTDLHDVNCGFKAIRKEVLSEIHLYGELHRFIPVMAHWRGFRIGEIVVEHRARPYGTSKYGIKRYFHGLADLLTVGFISRYETRPSHLFSIVGAAMSVAGAGMCSYLTVLWFMGHRPIGDRPLLLFGILLLVVGTQFFGMGLIAELVTRRHHLDVLPYTVRKVVRNPNFGDLPSAGPATQTSKEPL